MGIENDISPTLSSSPAKQEVNSDSTINPKIISTLKSYNEFDRTGFENVSNSDAFSKLSTYIKTFDTKNESDAVETKQDYRFDVVNNRGKVEYYFTVPKNHDELKKEVNQLEIIEYMVNVLGGKIKKSDHDMDKISKLSSDSFDKLALLISYILSVVKGNKMTIKSDIKDFDPIIARECLSILKNSDDKIKNVPANLILATTKISTFKAIFPDGTQDAWRSIYSIAKAISNIHTVKKGSELYKYMISQVFKNPKQILKDRSIDNIITSTGNCNAARSIMADDTKKLIDEVLSNIRKKPTVDQVVFVIENSEKFSKLKEDVNYILSPNKEVNIDLKGYDPVLKSFNRKRDKNSREKLEYLLSIYAIDKNGINIYNPTKVYIFRGCEILPIRAYAFEEAIKSFEVYEKTIESKINDISIENRNGIKREFARLCEYLNESEKEQ